MADAVTSQTIIDGRRRAVMKFTNISDGTGEAAVSKVTPSALGSHPDLGACTGVKIRAIRYEVAGMKVNILWDATADVSAIILTGYGLHDFSSVGGIPNNAGAGKTGIIQFSTIGAAANATYTIELDLVKTYG